MTKHTGKIIELIRERSSSNGNPKFTAIILQSSGFVELVTTAADNSLGYKIKNFIGDWVTYSRKQSRGKLVFTDLEPAELSTSGRYVAAEIKALQDAPTYSLQIRAVSGEGPGDSSTKWLNVSATKLQSIREILEH